MAGGKRGQIYFTAGTRNEICKRKEGGLEVVSSFGCLLHHQI